MNKPPLEILYQDEYFVAINKPNGLLVHRTKLAADATEFAVQILNNQLEKYVYPVHRLDRKTSGVLLFAFDKETTQLLQAALKKEATQKIYKAIVRGHFPESILVDYPLISEKGKKQEAITQFNCLEQIEVPVPFLKFQTSRYSIIEALPQTGRMHQIRKHCSHIFHPIIGDRPHGCNKQNKLFKEKWALTNMLLHAHQLSLSHPYSNKKLNITAPFPSEFDRILAILHSL